MCTNVFLQEETTLTTLTCENTYVQDVFAGVVIGVGRVI